MKVQQIQQCIHWDSNFSLVWLSACWGYLTVPGDFGFSVWLSVTDSRALYQIDFQILYNERVIFHDFAGLAPRSDQSAKLLSEQRHALCGDWTCHLWLKSAVDFKAPLSTCGQSSLSLKHTLTHTYTKRGNFIRHCFTAPLKPLIEILSVNTLWHHTCIFPLH